MLVQHLYSIFYQEMDWYGPNQKQVGCREGTTIGQNYLILQS